MKKSESGSKQLKEKQNRDELLRTYEDLLLKKEQYLKDGNSYRIAYVKEFGLLTADIFKARFECIRLKKTITSARMAINTGKKVNIEEINKCVDMEMIAYEKELKSILDENEDASKSEVSSAYDCSMAKKIYRRLAKKLHPDINKLTEKEPRLTDLWNKIMIAYYENNPTELEDLEVLVSAAFKDLGLEEFDIDIEDLEDRINALEIKIAIIVSNEPYTYGEFLHDKEKVNAKKEAMRKELKEYQDYAIELEEILAETLLEGGAGFTWKTKLG